MPDSPDWIARELEGLRQLRDEVRLQIHLGKADAREAWDEVEKRWHHLEAKLRVVREGSREDLGEIRTTAKQLAREIRDGYRHVKSLL
jgi:hypothetical protein